MYQVQQQIKTLSTKPQCVRQIQSKINVDCIKVCPANKNLWAFVFYEQMPQFKGGIQVIHTQQFNKQKQVTVGECLKYVEAGPIMHAEWLKTNHKFQTRYHLMLAAARCEQAIIFGYDQNKQTLQILERILIQKDVFLLYCDWKWLSKNEQMFEKEQSLQTIAILSSNQSTVYALNISIGSKQDGLQVRWQNKKIYNKHEYAVWACKICPFPSEKLYMVAGDEVNCLYLYDLQSESLIAKNKTAHSQGICQIVWKDKNTVLTGGFDGVLSQININNFVETIKRIQLGGTIWRIISLFCQKNEENFTKILVCNSSQKIFQILQYQNSKILWSSEKQHTSLAYAADLNDKMIITASFYDKQVRMWKI